jgi:hypothetical protein
MVLKSAESRTSLPFPPTQPEEKEVEKVADCDYCIRSIFFISIFYFQYLSSLKIKYRSQDMAYIDVRYRSSGKNSPNKFFIVESFLFLYF